MISLRSMLVGLGTMLAVAVPMVGQADAATKTVRLHASTATGESLQGPSFNGTTVNLAPTNVNSSRQKWQKTDIGGGFATYKLVSSIGSSREMCLAASSANRARSRRSATRAARRSTGPAASPTTAASTTAAPCAR